MAQAKNISIKTDEGAPRFQPPARRTVSVVRGGDPRYVTLTHDEGGHCTGYVLTEAGYVLIGQLASDGLNLALIAQNLGIEVSTFTKLRQRDPLAQEMIDRGRAVLTSEVIDTTVQHMRAGSLTAAIWLGKVRCGLVEQSGEVEGASPRTVNNTQININMPPAMSKEQFAELMAHTTLPAEPIDITPTKANVLK